MPGFWEKLLKADGASSQQMGLGVAAVVFVGVFGLGVLVWALMPSPKNIGVQGTEAVGPVQLVAATEFLESDGSRVSRAQLIRARSKYITRWEANGGNVSGRSPYVAESQVKQMQEVDNLVHAMIRQGKFNSIWKERFGVNPRDLFS